MGIFDKRTKKERVNDAIAKYAGKYFLIIPNNYDSEELDFFYEEGWEVIGIAESHAYTSTLFKKINKNGILN